jgi:XTP/dITP diphosphohydrolase
VADEGQILEIFSGCVEGRMILAEAGTGGFGYDPLFIPNGYSQTFAELDAGTKNRLSHRGKAMEQAREWLARRLIAAQRGGGGNRTD